MTIKENLAFGAVLTAITGTMLAIPLYFGLTRQFYAEEEYERGKPAITAEVISESYENSLSPVKTWDGIVSYSNETVKLDSKYTLTARRDDNGKLIAISVIDGDTVKKEALDALVSPGSKISFPRGNRKGDSPLDLLSDETFYEDDTQMGSKRADRIRVLE